MWALLGPFFFYKVYIDWLTDITFQSRFTLHPSVSLRAVAEKLPFTYTGADFYALCSDAMLKAVTRQASHVDAKIKAMSAERQQEITTAYFFDHFATPEDIDVMVTEEDLLAAHEELIPSVSAGELAHYERVRATFEGGRDKQQQQQQQRKDLGARTVSGASSVKGKGKGKGKAIASSSGGEEEDRQDGVNGKANKGKGKAVASGYGSGGDDEGLYD